MSVSPEAAAPQQSRAEELRERFHREDGWHGYRNRQMPTSRTILLDELDHWEKMLAERKSAYDTAQKSFARARQALQTASGEYYAALDITDVTRMALAEALEVPR